MADQIGAVQRRCDLEKAGGERKTIVQTSDNDPALTRRSRHPIARRLAATGSPGWEKLALFSAPPMRLVIAGQCDVLASERGEEAAHPGNVG
jgi:hypothetical protein